ncbi:Metallo-beta-lactamase superfamily protein [bacterium YEK0313]|nr:Metallo-beta-lactamase superfamily protein [bacterium YEK0313]
MPGLRPEDLLQPTPRGLYCPPADVYIDPLRPVGKALVTHGHSDHARAGHGAVLATAPTLAVMAIRYGEDFAGTTQAARWGEVVAINGVRFSFHPAGHIHGSAQIAVAHGGLRIVVSGDYKRAGDPTAEPFEVVPADVFITEATFGLPVFRHPDAQGEVGRLLASLSLFPERTHMVGAYALGKAQRVMALARTAGYDRPIFIHGALEKLTQFYTSEGFDFGSIRLVRDAERAELAGALVIGPPGAAKDLWARRFADPVTAFASGWMRVRARAKQGGIELPLVISDHADWDELGRTILDTGAGEVWVTHGQEDALVHWCGLNGLKAQPLRLVGYGDEDEAGLAGATPEAGSTA